MEKLHVPRPVARLAFVEAQCRGRRVVDLGAMDETAFAQKRGTGAWLHERIASVASEVLGIDSSDAVPVDGLATASNARIVRGSVMDVDRVLQAFRFSPEVCVAGEVIEHLNDPLAFLSSLAAARSLRGTTLVLTTPNATAAHNVAVGMLGRESMHIDHLLVLSYKTLHTLCRRAGLKDVQLIPYYAAFPEMLARNQGWRRSVVAAGERVVNGVEWCFPLLAFGWIVVCRISG